MSQEAAVMWGAQSVGFSKKGQLAQLKDRISATADAFAADFAAKSK
jgi:hypothetical protein